MALNAAERRQESPGLRAILGFKRSPQTAHYSAATGLRLDQDLLTFVQEVHHGCVRHATRAHHAIVQALPTGIVTFLLTDIEGSTRLWEAENEGMVIAAARHYALLDAIIAEHGGFRPIEQGEGDSIVAVFVKASDALAAAVDIQLAFAAEEWPLPSDTSARSCRQSADRQALDSSHRIGGRKANQRGRTNNAGTDSILQQPVDGGGNRDHRGRCPGG
jgi:class 3 adenylate cyclase